MKLLSTVIAALAVLGGAAGAVDVKWTWLPNPPDQEVLRYEAYCWAEDKPDLVMCTVVQAPATETVMLGLREGVVHHFYLKAVNSYSVSPPSTEIVVRMPVTPTPPGGAELNVVTIEISPCLTHDWQVVAYGPFWPKMFVRAVPKPLTPAVKPPGL